MAEKEDIEFLATAVKVQLSQGREGQPRAVHSMGLHPRSLIHSSFFCSFRVVVQCGCVIVYSVNV